MIDVDGSEVVKGSSVRVVRGGSEKIKNLLKAKNIGKLAKSKNIKN